MPTITCTVNGTSTTMDVAPGELLADVLRERLGLIGVKIGCGEGECGACTVLVNGLAVLSCIYPAAKAHRRQIVTIEGLQEDRHLHLIQQAFVDCSAAQCGYCTPGFIMSAAKLLEEIPHPTRQEAMQAITGNLCRCTGYYKILDAIEKAGRA